MNARKAMRQLKINAENTVQLYSFEPKGHEVSFFVLAKSKSDATKAVKKYIEEHIGKDDEHYINKECIKGWGTDHYELTIVEVGEVITKFND